jgi:hypothetical protein
VGGGGWPAGKIEALHSTRHLENPFPQPRTATHVKSLYSMWEVTGSGEGVRVALHSGPFLLWRAEEKEAGNCTDGGVGPHISNPSQNREG